MVGKIMITDEEIQKKDNKLVKYKDSHLYVR